MADDSKRARLLAGAIALLVWAAIAVQLGLNFERAASEGVPAWLVPFRLYGYFTIWANTLVALVTSHFALRGDTESLLARSGTRAATVVYIIVVGAIYNTLLAQYNPQTGLRLAIDTVFHTVVPVAYPLWWLLCVRRGRLGWGHAVPAMGLPLAYCAVAMGRGLLTGKYAYFFIDIGKYGLSQVLLNIAALALLYVALMAALIGLDRWLARGTAPAAIG
jgi:hypothetical protein